jgi:hypothetical protein
VLAAVLLGAAILPAHASGSARACRPGHCVTAGTVRWTRELPGSWLAGSGAVGTAPSQDEAYAAAGGAVAAIGFGLTVQGYDLNSGHLLWMASPATLPAFPAGAAIVSVRAWPGVVTVGVSIPAAGKSPMSRAEVVLSARTGAVVRVYQAAEYGGAVAADAARTVVVGTRSVTCYDNVTGRAIWSRPTGLVAQAWRVDGGDLYVTIAAGGYLGTAPVTALRKITLQDGSQQVIGPATGPFAGALSGAVSGVVLFSATDGLTAYSGTDGRQLWHDPAVVPETVDVVRQTLYVSSGDALIGIDPLTGARVRDANAKGSSALYEVRGGVALGLDQGSLGDAYGYSMASHRVVWTSPALPWPHYFVDLSGLGGSTVDAHGTVLLTSCAGLGSTWPSASAQTCQRPELVALSR